MHADGPGRCREREPLAVREPPEVIILEPALVLGVGAGSEVDQKFAHLGDLGVAPGVDGEADLGGVEAPLGAVSLELGDLFRCLSLIALLVSVAPLFDGLAPLPYDAGRPDRDQPGDERQGGDELRVTSRPLRGAPDGADRSGEDRLSPREPFQVVGLPLGQPEVGELRATCDCPTRCGTNG